MDISPKARKHLKAASDTDTVVMILAWLPLSGKHADWSRSLLSQGLAAVDQAIQQEKSGVLGALGKRGGVKVNDLVHTGQTIVKAPAATWKVWMSDPEVGRARFRLDANEVVPGPKPTAARTRKSPMRASAKAPRAVAGSAQ